MFAHLPPTAAPLSSRALIKGLFGSPRGKPAVAGFEQLLEKYFDTQKVFTFTSGRAAFRVILETIKKRPDLQNRKQVILPAYTCPVLVKAVEDAGLVPLLCDIRPASLDYEPEQLQQLAKQETLALVHVHLFGLPREREALESAAANSGALLIDDACQAMGAELEQRKIGSFCEMGFASFGPGKPLSLGGGGMLSVNSPGWATEVEETILSRGDFSRGNPLASPMAWMRLLALNFIFQPAGWQLATSLGLHKMGDDEKNWGYRLSRLTPVQARTGLESLASLESLNHRRRQNGEALNKALKDIPGLTCVPAPVGAVPGYLRFPLLVDDLEMRDRIFQQLAAAKIGVGKMYRKTLPDLIPDLKSGSYPGAEYVARHLLTLPVHQYVKEAHLNLMVQIITGITAGGETRIQSVNSIRINHGD